MVVGDEGKSTTEAEAEAELHLLFIEEEMEAARTLLDIKYCQLENFWPLTWFSEAHLKWGAKKKRSATPAPLPVLSSPSVEKKTSPPVPVPAPSVERRSSPPSEKTEGKVKPEATSPATPLAFSPSESDDEKYKIFHRKSTKKRSRDDLLKTVKELTDNKIALSKQLEMIKTHYDSILAYNRLLKTVEEQVKSSSVILSNQTGESQSQRNPTYHLDVSNSRNNYYKISLIPVTLAPPPPQPLQQPQQPLTVDGEQFRCQYPYFHHHQITTAPPLVSSNRGGFDRVNHVVGPIPMGSSNNTADLINNNNNASIEGSLRFGRAESLLQPLDKRAGAIADQKANYAAARWERRMKRKFKNHRKYPQYLFSFESYM